MVHLAVYNIAGQKVATVVDGEQPAGQHCVTWNSRDDRGRKISTGVYLYRMDYGGQSRTRRLVVLK
jgi:flagellar hook assembly protein FlgD